MISSIIEQIQPLLKDIYQLKKNTIKEKLKNGQKIKVVFLVVYASVWKLKDLYFLMKEGDIFEPIIVIIPDIVHNRENAKDKVKENFLFFQKNNYNVFSSYDSNNNAFIDIKNTINPDIVFFTNPHELSLPIYHIDNFLDSLTCYVPYGFMIANIQNDQFNQKIHNFAWQLFYETPAHVAMAKMYALNKGENVILTGYPLLDELFKTDFEFKSPWKKQNQNKKKIIWAPHHTIEEDNEQLAYSCFLKIKDFMLDVAIKYKDNIQIAFKPHPLLKQKLYSELDKNAVDEYYKKWEITENCQFEDNDYIDLFLTSDGMIMDSISFMSEYLVTGHPALFTVRNHTIKSKFNEYGKLCYETLYKTENLENDITDFIENIILKENDYMADTRLNFVEKYLKPLGDKTATENIYNHLVKELRGSKI